MFESWIMVIAALILNLAVIPYFVFLLATAVSAFLARIDRKSMGDARSRILIVIPAHNEASGIATTVRSCRSVDYPAGLVEVLVIADNCSDHTAALAAEAGARVVERFDTVKKSKGYAIEYLIASLMQSGEFDALDALVIVDADTTVDPVLLRCFDNDLRAGHDWIQCYYSVSNADVSARTRLMTYAFGLYNGVMPLGLNALGLSAGFKGNGMCLSTNGLRRMPWRSYGLVEDMEYSWTLRLAGEKIHFEPRASVYGAMVRTGGEAAANQRRRWEFGRKQIKCRFLGRFLQADGISTWERVASLLELSIPPMAWIVLAYAALIGVNAIMCFGPAAHRFPALASVFWAFSCLATLSLGFYGISPFLCMRLPWRYGLSLFLLPVYVTWKVLVSLAGPPEQWIRTARDPHVDVPEDHTRAIWKIQPKA